MEYPGKTRGCKSCGADTKDLDYYSGMAVLGKVFCKACRTEPAPEPARITIGHYGWVEDQVEAPCGNAPRCTNKVWHSFASHGGDMFDPEYPPLCSACDAEATARSLVTAGMEPEAALDFDLPFE